MKPHHLLLLLSPLLLAAGDAPGPVGRYRLHSCQIDVGATTVFTTHQLFRIDSATGRTWVYLATSYGDRVRQTWTEITEPAMTVPRPGAPPAAGH